MDYTISLYYVEGINNVDTPFFSSKGEQSTFFNSKLITSITASYYPPYYRNRIRLSKEDIDFNTNINYISLNSDERTYYYFILRCDYITDGIIELDVMMDTIQTYMFDIIVNYCVVERMFVNRYDGDNINRDYIRENISCNTFSKLSSYNVVNSDKSKWVTIGKYSEYPLSSTTIGDYVQNYSLKNEDNVQLYSIPECITYTPFYTGNFVKDSKTYSIGSADLLKTVDNVYQTDAYIIPFPCLANFKITSGTITDASSTDVINLSDKSGFTNYLLINQTMLQTSVLKYEYNFGFIKNTAIKTLFSARYAPVLLDENYIQFVFGDNEVSTHFPLYYLTSNIINCLYWADIGTGYRYYMLNDTADVGTNKYQTIISNSNVPSYTLRNDAWKTYISRNKATLASAVISDSLNITSNVINAATRYETTTERIEGIIDNPKSYTPKRHQLKKKYQQRVAELEDKRDAEYTASKLSAIGSANQVGNYLTNEMNLKYTPAVITRNGAINSSLIGMSLYVSYRMYHSDDYENCAQYYHRNGYLVNKYFSSVDNIFTLVKSRYYYDVLKCSDIDIHLRNCIETQELIANIEHRFTTGLRLWYIDKIDIGNFAFDNVELDYVKEA